MKKLLVVMLAMAIAISFGSMAMAKNGLSVELGLAYNPNGADMGEIIHRRSADIHPDKARFQRFKRFLAAC